MCFQPVILHTDIGSDIDDFRTLVMFLRQAGHTGSEDDSLRYMELCCPCCDLRKKLWEERRLLTAS